MVMGTFSWTFNRILRQNGISKKKAPLWWLEMTDTEQRTYVRRGITLAACSVAATLLLPVFVTHFEAQRTQAAYEADLIALSRAENPADVVRDSRKASVILDHPWLRSVEHALERTPRSALSRYAKRDRDGAALATVIDFHPDLYDQADHIAAEHKCMTQAVYYEAGFERTEGKLAVAEVIMNRVADHRYPNSVCEVVFQGATRTTGCQFTFTCDGALNRKPNPQAWKAAEGVASHVLLDLHERRTGNATHYHATYVDPIWSAGLVRTQKIDKHIFYRFPRGSEWAAARQAVARRQAYRTQQAVYKPANDRVIPLAEASADTQLQAITPVSTAAPAP